MSMTGSYGSSSGDIKSLLYSINTSASFISSGLSLKRKKIGKSNVTDISMK
jgi:hypothetical protein